MTDDPTPRVKTTETAFDIVTALQDLEGAGVTELAERLDLGTSTVYDHLATLRSMGYVAKRGEQYHLGLRFLDHGIFVRQADPLYEYAQPTVEDLVEQTEEIVWLVTEQRGKAVNLDKSVASNRIEKLGGRVGERTHLHSHDAGKALFAFVPENRRGEIIDEHGLPSYTRHTITDREALREELADIRERGYAQMDGEFTEGIRGVGAPIRFDGDVIGSISVTGPTNRLPTARFREELPEVVLGAANEIELRLSYNVDSME